MFLSHASVRRPVAMSCLIIGLTLLGINAFRKLSLELLPKLELPFITVVTVYPGANPADIETDVAKRIEDAVVAIDGLKHVSSSCMENVCHTLLEFRLGTDVDVAATDVREKIDLIAGDLPAAAEDPVIQKFDVNATPIVVLALTGDVPLDALYDFADNTLKDRITTIPGVAGVQIIGGAEREVHIALDRERLAARGLTTMHVVRAVQNGMGVVPAGRVQEADVEFAVKYDADFATIQDIASLEITRRGNQRCRVRDVGRVWMTTEEVRQQAILDGRPAVAVKVVKKADANAVAMANEVREAMTRLRAGLPGGMELVWFSDDGRFIEATNLSAWVNVLEGIALTALILFLFLYNLRALLVVAVTMPLTILIGLFFMQMMDLSLNTSTLIAIGMSVGILVTNSIVVLEAIVKHLDATGDPVAAATLGAQESFIAVLASAGTNMVVLFPLTVMGSMVGLFMRPLALTMFIMTLVSLFISFTLTPLLCSLLMRPRGQGERNVLARLEAIWNRGLTRLIDLYRAGLYALEQRRWAALLVVLAAVGLLVHALALAGTLGGSMVNEPDKAEITVKLEFPTACGLDMTRARVAQAEARLKDLPLLVHRLTTIGKVEGIIGQASEGVYLAQISLRFPQRDERDISIHRLLDATRARLADFPGAIVTVSRPTLIGGTGSDVEMEIAGESLPVLNRLALRSQELANTIPGFRDADTTVRTGKPELRLRPRRTVLSDLGLAGRDLGLMLRANLEGMEAGTYKQNARNYDVVVKLEPQKGRQQVSAFQIPGTPGKPLVIESVSRLEEDLAPVQITRVDKRRVNKLLANLEPSLPLGTAVSRLTGVLADKGRFPPGYDIRFAGRYEVMAEAQKALGEAGITAIVLVILTLAAILESFKQPVLILVTLPLALIGTVWALALAGMSFGIFEIMGMVMMVGIVVNNAILIMDQFNVHVHEGIPRHKAMVTAACERFRPIAMITLAAVLGMLPLAFGAGIGAEMRNGVGVASMGGILVSGVLTLIVMPVLYDLFTARTAEESPPRRP